MNQHGNPLRGKVVYIQPKAERATSGTGEESAEVPIVVTR